MIKPLFVDTPARILGVGVAVILIVAACGGLAPSTPASLATPTPQATPSGRGAGGVLRMQHSQPPTMLNPHFTNSLMDWEVGRMTYEPLASFDKTGNLIPFLAVEIPSLENGGISQDGKSVTWKLKPEVKWSDGEPFTAQDVVFTYRFITNREVGALSASTYSVISDVVRLDDYTIRIIFKAPNPAWALLFVGSQGVILPEHIYAPFAGKNAIEAPANKFPVGTGPYRVVSFKPQEVLFLGTQLIETNKIVLEPNPYFREPDKPYFSRVEVHGGGTVDEAARLVFEVGSTDYAWNLQLGADVLGKLEAGGLGKLLINEGARTERLLLNRTDPNKETSDGERSSRQFPHPFFKDLKVRQAFAYAVDRKALAALLGRAGVPVSNNLVAPLAYNSLNTSFEYNLDKARALLDEAGWKDTDGDRIRDQGGLKLKVVFQTSVNSVRQASQQIIKAALEQIGVEVELKIIESGPYFSNDFNPNNYRAFYADMQMYREGNRSPDPGSYMQFWTCPQIPQKANNWKGDNVERWCNPEYDALYELSTKEFDPQKRQKLFIAMNDMLVNDVVMIPLILRAEVSGASVSLTGIELTPWDAETWLIKDWRRTSP